MTLELPRFSLGSLPDLSLPHSTLIEKFAIRLVRPQVKPAFHARELGLHALDANDSLVSTRAGPFVQSDSGTLAKDTRTFSRLRQS